MEYQVVEKERGMNREGSLGSRGTRNGGSLY